MRRLCGEQRTFQKEELTTARARSKAHRWGQGQALAPEGGPRVSLEGCVSRSQPENEGLNLNFREKISSIHVHFYP